MKPPTKNKDWAKEVMDSLNMAVEMVVTRDPDLSRDSLENVYQYGPWLCLKNRGVTDAVLGEEVTAYAIEERVKDFEIEPDDTLNYSVNFLLAYLDSHVFLQIISEKKMDEIMAYIIDNYEIDI